MEGYEVVSLDDDKIGKVVGVSGKFLIVEQGMLLKSKHAVPRELARVDEAEQKVRVTVSKDIVASSPKVDDDTFDERAAAEHYGLAPSDGPGTEGYGVTDAEAGDPSRSAAEQAARQGLESTEAERVRIREQEEANRLERSSPTLLGDRLAGSGERKEESP